ncbi:hypothetical protein F2Q69_00040954 [Brassica cretica]|uniref:Uncharacterized protein n=1 Tax=Brassica cretica TaxID=69181 RepID=A0A8S9NCF5_BRACR|nr:hypothetical protein F2Q69_00040954 [Brassica cretica]
MMIEEAIKDRYRNRVMSLIGRRPMITVTHTLTIELIQETSLLRYLRCTDDSRGMRMNATEYLTPVDPDAQEELIPVFYLAA